MDIKEIAELSAVPAVHPPTAEAEQAPAPVPEGQGEAEQGALAALRPVLKIDTDGLVLLQFQDDKSGEVVFQVPSEEATRQYRERGTGASSNLRQADEVAGVIGSAAAAAAVVPPPAPPPSAPQQAPNTVSVQAVKPVEPSGSSSQAKSVRVNA